MSKAGRSAVHNQRHITRDHKAHWLGDQWDAVSLFAGPVTGVEDECFIQSFPATPAGEADAWRLAGRLTAILTRRQLAGRLLVKVQKRARVGWGVWLIAHRPREGG